MSDIPEAWDAEYVAALRAQIDGYEAIARGMVAQARREVLADLRAKVEALPRIAAVSRGTGAYVPCVQLSDVLALIEEVGRG